MEITDELMERVNSEIYAERRKRDGNSYKWETWADFVSDPYNAERVPIWRSDSRFGIETIARILGEAK